LPSLAACTSESGTDKPNRARKKLRLGLVVPQSGAARTLGDEINNGFRLYLRNQGGQLGGRSVDLVEADEGETPETARIAVERLLQDRVVAIAGVSNASALASVRALIEEAKVPLVTPSPSSSALQGAVYVWRTGFVTEDQGIAMAKWLAGHSDRLAVLSEDTPSARSDVRAFADTFLGAHGVLAGDPKFVNVAATDFTPQFHSIRSSGVKEIYCVFSDALAVNFIKQLKAAPNLPDEMRVYGPGLLTEGTQLSHQGDAAVGIYTALNYSSDLNNVPNQQFVSEYQKAYNTTPATQAMASYDAAMVLDQAIGLVGDSATSRDINGAIGQLGQVDSPRGTWQFNQTRTPLQRWFLRQVKADGPVLSNMLTAELGTLG
jgi:branched-chain amino acid transport system substrate-binding protein